MSRKSRKKGGGRNKSIERRNKKAQVISNKKVTSKSLPSTEETSTTTDMHEDFQIKTEILKVDEELGLVLGWAIISNIDGEPYFDVQGDHIPEDAMFKAASDFMSNSRVAGHMHKVEDRGSVVFAFPMTAEVAKAFGVETKTTGLMIAMKPDEEMMEKFKDGTLTGFSIGGKRGVDEEVTA